MSSAKGTEKALLLAVRTWLRTATGSGGGGYSTAQCDVEYVEMAASVAPDVFVCINAGGFDAGPTQNTSGQVRDMILGCEITVFRRCAHIARDRKTSVYLTGSSTLQDDMENILDVIDWNYSINTTANTTLAAAPYSSSYGFIEPLRFAGMDASPRKVSSKAVFAAGQTDEAAMCRTIRFTGARRIVPV